ncbi:ribosome small subunit-dependent GTPase A [Parolsenella catena]|uniref:ribosome small subunit-dependent GTPase A n=1 Tax=Parolsenella catena TaxID=2003188 RepID=UPI00294389C1|nr:ribosome small subunit-dependent GTPase A [Parolsenella catena]
MGKRSHKARPGSTTRRRSPGGGASRPSAEDVLCGLPVVGELENVPSFADMAPTQLRREQLEEARERIADRLGRETANAVELGCVVRLDRGFPLVACEGRTLRAEHAPEFAKGDSAEAGIMPTVGDWVAVAVPPEHDMGVIHEVLPRRNAFARWRGGRRGEFQTLAANLDGVIVVAALGAEELPLARIARSVVLARDCGVRPSVVLTKADRKQTAEALEADALRVHRLVGEQGDVVVTSSVAGEGLDGVRALVPAGSVAMILGESGAGKSTLLNALLGADALATGAVRERDDMGRHTTVARMMVKLPGAGVICDAPGLRSLPLVGHERGLAKAFPEISELAATCRFRDCTHGNEPGCAVREAREAGELDEVRVESYLALANEMRASASTLDPDVVL